MRSFHVDPTDCILFQRKILPLGGFCNRCKLQQVVTRSTVFFFRIAYLNSHMADTPIVIGVLALQVRLIYLVNVINFNLFLFRVTLLSILQPSESVKARSLQRKSAKLR
jgi:hypothetical protein